MPIYEYQGQKYDIETTDHVEAKNKILAHLGKSSEVTPAKEATSEAGSFAKAAVENVVPATTGLYAAGQGARAGFMLPGPLPVKVGGAVVGGLGGGLLGGMAGEEAQQFAAKYIPESFKESLGMDPQQRALDVKENPYSEFAGKLAPNLAFFRPGAVAPLVTAEGKTILGSGAQRAIMGGAGAGIEGGSEFISEGKVDPVKMGMAGLFQAGAPVSTRLGAKVFGDIAPHVDAEKLKMDPKQELLDKAVYNERVIPVVEERIQELRQKLDASTNENTSHRLAKQLHEEEQTLFGMKEDLRKIKEMEANSTVESPQQELPGMGGETPPKTDVNVPTSDAMPVGEATLPVTTKEPFVAGRTSAEVHENFISQLEEMDKRAWGTDNLDRVIANKEAKLVPEEGVVSYSSATTEAITKEVEVLKAIRDGKMTPAEAIDHLRNGEYDAISHVVNNSPEMVPALQAAVKANRILDGVQAIATHESTPAPIRNLANRLLKNPEFGKFTNIFYDNQIKHGMQTAHQTGDIAVRSGADVNPTSFMHESVHTSTSGAMLLFGKGRRLVSPTVAKAMDNILGIYDALKGKHFNALVKALDGDVKLADLLLTNERELLAYALTDEKFTAALMSMHDGNKSVFTRLLDNIADAFGFTKKQEKNLFDSLYESAGTLIDEYSGNAHLDNANGFDPIFNYRDKDGDIGMGAADKFIPIAKRFLSPWTFKNFWRDNQVINAISNIDSAAQKVRDQAVSLIFHGKTTVEQYKKLGFLQRLDKASSPEGLSPALQQVSNKELGEIIPMLLKGERDGLRIEETLAQYGTGLSAQQRNAARAIERAGALSLDYANGVLSARKLPEVQERLGYFLKSNNGDHIVTASQNGVVTRMEFYLTQTEANRAAKRLQETGYGVEVSERQPNTDYEGILQTLNDILEKGNATNIPLEQLIQAKTESIESQTSAIGGHKKHRGLLHGFAGDISSLTVEQNGKAFRHSLEANVKSYADLVYKRQLAYDSAAYFNSNAELTGKQPNATSVAKYYLDNQLGQLQSPAEGKISNTVNSLLNEGFAKAFPDVHMERDVIPYAYNLITRGAYNMVLTSAPVTWVTQTLGFLQSGRMLFKDNSNPLHATAAVGKALSNVVFKQYSDDALEGMHYIAQNTEVFHKHMTSEVADYEWSTDKKNITSKLYRWFSGEVFTSAGDAFSRVVAWNMANELLVRSNPEMTPRMRWEKAGDMTAESMIKMGRENLPGMYKELGFIGSAISPLKSYVHGQFSNLAVDVKDVLMQPNAANSMALAMNALGMLVVGGGLSLPFLADYEYLRQAAVKNGMIAYDALPNWTKFMEEQDPVISRGLISGLTGIDLGASMRYQSIMKPFAETLGAESWTDAVLPLKVGGDVLSGASTLVKNLAGNASDWQVDKALEKVIPRGYVRGAIDAARHAGETTTKVGERGESFTERGTPEVVAKLMGSRSLGEAKAGTIRNEDELRTASVEGRRQKAVDMFLSTGKGDTDRGLDIAVDLMTKGEWSPTEFTNALKTHLDKQTRTYVERRLMNKRNEIKSMAQKRALTNVINMLDLED